jgi:hypothetical protein
MRLKGLANREHNRRRYPSTWHFPGYEEASERCTAARRALRKLERALKRS